MKKTLIIVAIFCTVALGATIKHNISLNAFNAGELSPLINSRSDIAQYKVGAKTLTNMLVRAQGPIQRRPGTKFIASVKDATDTTRLIPFSDSNNYIIETGDDYARFFTDGAAVNEPNGSGNPYEVVTPWDANDVMNLHYATAEGVMRIVDSGGDYKPYKLYRPDDTNDANWVCEAITMETGPFLDENTDKTWTITADSNVGDVNLTSTDPLWYSGHVGALWQISHIIDANGIQKEFWTNNYPSGGTEESGIIKVRKNQYYDVITNHDWFGTFKIQRSYDSGSTWETIYSITARYMNAVQYAGRETEETCIYRMQMVGQYVTNHNYRHYEKMCQATFNTRPMTYNGVVEISTVDANGLMATATVKIELASTAATWRWAEGAWSDYRGWPRSVEYFESRVIYGGSKSYPETIWASIIATKDSEYDEFTANTESDITGNLGGPDDIAWTYTYPGMGEIRWIKAGKYLLVGTNKGVSVVGQQGRPLTPNYPPIMRQQNYQACASLQPAEAGNALLYVEKGAEKIRELEYTYSSEKYIAPDMTILAEHITDGGIVDLTFQSRPDPILWCVRSDGALLSFTYMTSYGVEAWAEHNTGASGQFASITRIPSDNEEDDLWAVIDRTINSSDVKYIEQFQPMNFSSQSNMFFVDCGDTDPNSISHLEAESVVVLADGVYDGTYTVSSGAIAATSATTYAVGLPYTSVFETMPLVSYDRDYQASSSYISRVSNLVLDLYRTMTYNVGTSSTYKSSQDITTLYTGLRPTEYPRGQFREPTIYIDCNEPSAFTLRGITATMETTYIE